MRKKLFLLITGISLILCSCSEQLTSRKKSSKSKSSSEQNYMVKMNKKTKIINVISGDSKYGLKKKSPREVKGCITIGTNTYTGPSCGSYCVTSGKTAIELSFADQKNKSKLSPAAKAVLKKYGCPANYLNKHSSSISLIPATRKLHKKFKTLKAKDMVKLKGYDVSMETVTIKGKTARITGGANYFYVTQAVINNKKY